MLRYSIIADDWAKQALRGIAPIGSSLAMLCKNCSAEAFLAESVPPSHHCEAPKQRGAAASQIQPRHPTPFQGSLKYQGIGIRQGIILGSSAFGFTVV